MAKKELENQDTQNVTAQADVNSQPSPVEKQQALHDESANVTQHVLQPGKTPPVGEDLLGEITSMIHKAEQEGNLMLAAELKNMMVKLGDLLSHLHELEKKAADDTKALYKKVIAFFKK
jgi:hypothetical protein